MSVDRWKDKEVISKYSWYYIIQPKKKKEKKTCSNMDGPRGYYTKWNKSDRERQLSYDFSYTWNPKAKTNKTDS